MRYLIIQSSIFVDERVVNGSTWGHLELADVTTSFMNQIAKLVSQCISDGVTFQ